MILSRLQSRKTCESELYIDFIHHEGVANNIPADQRDEYDSKLRYQFPVVLPYLNRRDLNFYRPESYYLTGSVSGYCGHSFLQRNYYCLSSLGKLGGKYLENVLSVKSDVRYGGGLADRLLYLKKYNRDYRQFDDVEFSVSIDDMIRELNPEGVELRALDLEDAINSTSFNLDANSGPSFQAVGYTNKLSALNCAISVARCVYSRLSEGRAAACPVFSLAGRAKLKKSSEHIDKILSGSSSGRAVWMADSHESILCNVFTIPLTEFFKSSQRCVLIGFDKYGSGPRTFIDRFEGFCSFICADYSEFDASVPNGVIHRAFALVSVLLGIVPGSNSWKLLKWLEGSFINTLIMLPNGLVVRKDGGIPSGSGFTSIIGSLCNYIMLRESTYKLYGPECFSKTLIATYGDDAVIGLPHRQHSVVVRNMKAREDLVFISKFIKSVFGATLHVVKSIVAHRLLVKFIERKFDQSSSGWVDSKLRRYCKSCPTSQELNGTLDHEKYLLYSLQGYGSYSFTGSVKFLSYYFTADNRMVRPSNEVLTRLVNPERKLKTLDDYRSVLLSALVEGFFNPKVVALLFHLLYDLRLMKGSYILSQNAAKQSYLYDQRLFNSGLHPTQLKRVTRSLERGWYRRDLCVDSDFVYDSRIYSFFSEFVDLMTRVHRVWRESHLGYQFTEYYRKRKLRGTSLNILKNRIDVTGPTFIVNMMRQVHRLTDSKRYVKAAPSYFHGDFSEATHTNATKIVLGLYNVVNSDMADDCELFPGCSFLPL